VKEEVEKPSPNGVEAKLPPQIPIATTVLGRDTVTKLTLKGHVPWDKLSDLMRCVFIHLN
jgi:hypothetical protein